MIRFFLRSLMLLTAATAISGCSSRTPLTPPKIHYGQDVCAKCKMIISEPAWAAAAIVEDADGMPNVHLYDDIGCMLADPAVGPHAKVLARYVHDRKTQQWIPADAAIYVGSEKIQTPMAGHVAAYASRPDADAAAKLYAASTVSGYAQLNRAPAVAKAAVVGDAKVGQQIFAETCFACHGPTGAGLPNLGLPLRTSPYVAAASDQQLIDFIKKGRMPTDPGAQGMVPMPPRAGNPTLTDAKLADVVAYLRQLQEQAKDAGESMHIYTKQPTPLSTLPGHGDSASASAASTHTAHTTSLAATP